MIPPPGPRLRGELEVKQRLRQSCRACRGEGGRPPSWRWLVLGQGADISHPGHQRAAIRAESRGGGSISRDELGRLAELTAASVERYDEAGMR